MATLTKLMTAEEFAQLPETGAVRELVRGKVVEMNQPYPRHGEVCGNVHYLVRQYLEGSQLGRVVINDSGIVTERDPDTVRGGDVWYVSYRKVPKGPLPPRGYLDAQPDIVFEVVSASDRRSRVLTKVGEYLEAGIPVVCVLDPEDESVRIYHPDRPEVDLTGDDLVTFPEQLPGFAVPARRFFE